MVLKSLSAFRFKWQSKKDNLNYLQTKKHKLGHMLSFNDSGNGI